MKTFNVNEMPEELQAILRNDIIAELTIDNEGGAMFCVNPAPDPELGNMHVPVAQWLVKRGANKLETVYLKDILDVTERPE